MIDLSIKGGRIVTSTVEAISDIGIDGGRIVSVGAAPTARKEIDASGLIVVPGGVDPHVHLASRPATIGTQNADDYFTGSVAAACGGITSIVNYVWQLPGVTLTESLSAAVEEAQRDSVVDFSFHLIPRRYDTPTLAEIPQLVERGFRTFKIFMSLVTDDEMIEAMAVLARAGGRAMVHCQNPYVDGAAWATLEARGATGARQWAEAHPPIGEIEATSRALDYSAFTGCPTCIVHVSALGALERIAAAKSSGQDVLAETRPCYLLFTRERYRERSPQYLGYTGYPPLREPEDVAGIWQGLKTGTVDFIGSDHSPWTLADKATGADDCRRLPIGIPAIETMTRVIYSEGVTKGRISENRFVEVTATKAAAAFGLQGKGEIATGRAADLLLIDPKKTDRVNAEQMHSRAGYEPCEGMRLTGRLVRTLRRGDTLCVDGRFVGSRGAGTLVPRD